MNTLKNKLITFTPLHFTTPARKSAVAIIIYRENNTYKLLLTERSKQLNNHPGEISFPGGTYDFDDRNLLKTAIRETREELEIHLSEKDCIGQLNDIWTLTGYLIQPYVFFMDQNISYQLNPEEIHSVLEVPVSFFQKEQTKTHSVISYKNRKLNSFTYNYEGQTIWGATATIIHTLFT